MNTKNITDKEERKKAKRTARKEAPPKAKRPSDVPRGANKRKIRHAAKGLSKR